MINPFRSSFRTQFLLGFLACAALLGYAFHTQFRDVNPLDPCPLCIFQRIAFFALGVVFLLGALLFSWPLLALFNVPAWVAGVPLLYAYLFAAWAGLIVLIAVVSSRSQR